MKKLIMAILIVSFFFSIKILALAEEEEFLQINEVCQNVEKVIPMRKISISRLLTGLGSTCFHLGMAIMSSDNQGKQQAALGVVGSLLTMAGGIVGEQEKEKAGEDDVDERKRRLEGLVRNCLVEIKNNPLYLEKNEQIKSNQLRSVSNHAGSKFFEELEISGEAIQELIAEIFYMVRDAFKSGLAFVGITRSPNQGALEDSLNYIEELLFLSVNYVTETASFSVRQDIKADESVIVEVEQEEIVEDLIEYETENRDSE